MENSKDPLYIQYENIFKYFNHRKLNPNSKLIEDHFKTEIKSGEIIVKDEKAGVVVVLTQKNTRIAEINSGIEVKIKKIKKQIPKLSEIIYIVDPSIVGEVGETALSALYKQQDKIRRELPDVWVQITSSIIILFRYS